MYAWSLERIIRGKEGSKDQIKRQSNHFTILSATKSLDTTLDPKGSILSWVNSLREQAQPLEGRGQEK